MSGRLKRLEKCIGCGACKGVCPKSCIKLEQDKEGFIVAEIDEAQCIDCGMCERVCPLKDTVKPQNHMQAVYFWVNKTEYDRNLSSSGGFFKALSDWILQKGGVVYGAAFTPDFMIEHKRAEAADELYPLMGSKYVQSNTKDTFIEVKEQLLKDRWVLYSGTPCQIAGLKAYLGKEYEKLITLDVFCHGVPSQGVWKKYLEEYHSSEEIRYIQFRYKALGWWQFGLRIQYAHSDYYSAVRKAEDDYIRAFLKDITLNENCYHCKFRTKEKYSDFFIGDAWNINKVKVNMDDDRGITTVVVNSKKGHALLNEIKKDGHCFPISMEDGVYSRKELFADKETPVIRDKFFRDFEQGFRYAVERNQI